MPAEPETFDAWKHYLATTPADAVFILGDLFEVWVGDDVLPMCPASRPIAPNGAAQRVRAASPVFFMHGNRDFLVGPAFARATGVQLLADPTVLVRRPALAAQPRRRALPGRHRVPRLPRAGAHAGLAGAVPGPATRPNGRRTRAVAARPRASSASDRARATPTSTARPRWPGCGQATAPTLVHGHTHRPADHDSGCGPPPHRADRLGPAARPPATR
jgi:UDP-2,3-diacylglucosamine hydrolase